MRTREVGGGLEWGGEAGVEGNFVCDRMEGVDMRAVEGL